jgi:hypothetical protein
MESAWVQMVQDCDLLDFQCQSKNDFCLVKKKNQKNGNEKWSVGYGTGPKFSDKRNVFSEPF